MTFSSYLADDSRPLVLDTSVLINLHACTVGERVLMALANDIVVADIVVTELNNETGQTSGGYGFLAGLIDQGKVAVSHLSKTESDLFLELTSTSPTLDDGEAATIAMAKVRGFRAVVDERKGRARALTLMGEEVPAWTIEILRMSSVVQGLGEHLTADAVFFALRDGRMRIPVECCEEVVALIGRQRALQCTCLPNFKSLKL